MALAEIQQQMERAAGWASRALRYCRPNRFARSEDGGSMIEFALISTAMMTFILVVMQICVALYTYGMITEVARETTRWASTRGSTCQTPALTSCTATQASIISYAKSTGLPNIGGGTITVDPNNMFPDTYAGNANCQNPSVCRVMVHITYTVPITMPLVPRNSISLTTISELYYLQ